MKLLQLFVFAGGLFALVLLVIIIGFNLGQIGWFNEMNQSDPLPTTSNTNDDPPEETDTPWTASTPYDYTTQVFQNISQETATPPMASSSDDDSASSTTSTSSSTSNPL